MNKILLPMLCALLPLHALAINKCEVDGKITYTEKPCEKNGREIMIAPPPSNGDVQQARDRASNQKANSIYLESERMSRHNTALQADESVRIIKEQKMRCQELEQRKRVRTEEGPDAVEDLEEKPKGKTPSAAEKYELECAGK